MSKKKDRPFFNVTHPGGKKEKMYMDKEGREERTGSIITDIIRMIFK